MNNFLQIFLLYLLNGILNTLIYIRYIESTGLPGGDVGMIPIGIMIGSLISLILSILFYYLLQLKIKINTIKAILLYEFIFLLVAVITFDGGNPFKQGMNNYNNTTLWMYLTSFISTAIILFSYLLIKAIKNKTKESK